MNFNFGGGGELPKYLSPSQRKAIAGWIACGYTVKKTKRLNGQQVEVDLSSTQRYHKGAYEFIVVTHLMTLLLNRYGQDIRRESTHSQDRGESIYKQFGLSRFGEKL